MIEIFVYDEEDDVEQFLPKTALSIEEFLKEQPSWKPKVENVILLFQNLPLTVNDEINNFGNLGYIIPQLIEAHNRLKKMQFGLLRTATFNEPIYFILDPSQATTYLSLLYTLPMPYSSYFPLSDSPIFVGNNLDQQKELYDYIELNKNQLKSREISGIGLGRIRNVALSTDVLLTSLIKQAELGKELLIRLSQSSL